MLYITQPQVTIKIVIIKDKRFIHFDSSVPRLPIKMVKKVTESGMYDISMFFAKRPTICWTAKSAVENIVKIAFNKSMLYSFIGISNNKYFLCFWYTLNTTGPQSHAHILSEKHSNFSYEITFYVFFF